MTDSDCPLCNSTRTKHNPVFSYENGAGEIRQCLDCGASFDVEFERGRRECLDEDGEAY